MPRVAAIPQLYLIGWTTRKGELEKGDRYLLSFCWKIKCFVTTCCYFVRAVSVGKGNGLGSPQFDTCTGISFFPSTFFFLLFLFRPFSLSIPLSGKRAFFFFYSGFFFLSIMCHSEWQRLSPPFLYWFLTLELIMAAFLPHLDPYAPAGASAPRNPFLLW